LQEDFVGHRSSFAQSLSCARTSFSGGVGSDRRRASTLLVVLAICAATVAPAADPSQDQSFDAYSVLGQSGVSVSGFLIGGGADLAQTFTVGASGNLTRIDLQINGRSGVTQPILVDIRATVGGLPSDGNSIVLATATVPANLVPTTVGASATVDFSATPIAVQAGEVLAIVLRTSETVGIYSWNGASASDGSGAQLYAAGAGLFRNTSNTTWRSVVGPTASGDFGFRTFVETQNVPPAVHDGTVTTAAATAIDAVLWATDPLHRPLTFSIVSQPASGAVTLIDASTGAFTYAPNAGVLGLDKFTFRATSSTGISSTVATELVFIAAASPTWSGQTTRASVSTGGAEGNDHSESVSLSASGRWIAFSSSATNFAPPDTAGLDIFVRDRVAGTTTRVSVPVPGLSSFGDSRDPVISADGRFVAFSSTVAGLVTGDTNGATDIFVADRQTTQVNLLSRGYGGDAANGASDRPAISADGSFIAFSSVASNLVAEDGNGVSDIFLASREGNAIRVSNGLNGEQANGASTRPAISADGRFVVFVSAATNLVAGDTNNRADIFVYDSRDGSIGRASVSSAGEQANNSSGQPSISADGRSVSFESAASNLVPNDTNGGTDVFVRDRLANITERVSLTTEGAQASGISLTSFVSTDGHYVAFYSSAALVADDTNNALDVYVRDRGNGTTRRVSLSSDGAQAISPGSSASSLQMSADNRFIAFISLAANLAENDTNTRADVFVAGGVTVTPTNFAFSRAGGSGSVDVSFVYPGMPGAPWVAVPSVSWIALSAGGGVGNGQAQFSVAPNPASPRQTTLAIAGQPVGIQQAENHAPVAVDDVASTPEDTPVVVRVKDNDTDADGDTLIVSMVSEPAHGTVAINGTATVFYAPARDFHGIDSFSYRVVDGQGVESSTASVLVTVTAVNDAPVAWTGVATTLERAVVSGLLQATDEDGDSLTFRIAAQPMKGSVAITDAATGTFTYTPSSTAIGYDAFTFVARDGNVDSPPATEMVFVTADSPRWPGQTVMVSRDSSGVRGNNQDARPSISADGRITVFDAVSTNLVPGDTNNTFDVFVNDRATGQTTRVSVASGGVQANNFSDSPAVSADGRYVVFRSAASNLVPGDTNGKIDVFVHDRTTNQTTRASVASDGTEGNADSGGLRTQGISADGRYTVFTSAASNLVTDDTNGVSDVFVHDAVTGRTSRASVATDATQANNASDGPGISADGRVVAFHSTASNLVPSDTNNSFDVFVHDMVTGQTDRISVSSGGLQANSFSSSPGISADGRYVAFRSQATNLVTGDTNGQLDVFVRDRVAGRTDRVSTASDGTQGNGASGGPTGSETPTLSANGRYVAFPSTASNLVDGDNNGVADVFVRDLLTGVVRRVSLTEAGTENATTSGFAVLSSDGRFVTFHLTPTNVSTDFDIFVTGGVQVTPTSNTVPAAGGSGEIHVSIAYPGPVWTATSNAGWITVTGQSSTTGDGTVTYAVARNVGPARSGSLAVAGQTVTIAQGIGVDATPPVINGVPASLVLEAVSPAGAAAVWASPSATDDVDGAVPVVCTPASGALFPLGTTQVTCSAADAAGNGSERQFTVSVGDTAPPALAITYPDRDAFFLISGTTSSIGVTVQASDAVGVSSLRVNSIAAALVSGTAQSGTWQANVPITRATALPFNAVAADIRGNQRSVSVVVDNDGIQSAIDKNRTTLADDSAVYSSSFVSGQTLGTIGNGSVYLMAAPVGNVVRLAAVTNGGTGVGTAYSLCTGTSKWVELNANELAYVWCVGSTLYVQALVGAVDVVRYDGSSCGWWSGCTYYYTHMLVSQGYVGWLGSPVTADPQNPGPLHVEIIKVTTAEPLADVEKVDTSLGEVIGSFDVDGGESVDVAVAPIESGTGDAVTLTAVIGTVTVTLSGEIRTLNTGEHATTEIDLTPPILGAAPDLVVEATSPAGAMVSYPLPSVSDNKDPSPRVTGTPASGSVFPIGNTVVTLRATDTAGNVSTRAFKVTVRDTIAPVAAPVASPSPNAAGWNREPVTITWNWSDGGSGVTSNCQTSTMTSAAGVAILSATCRDAAGNTGNASYMVRADPTPPVVQITGPQNGATYLLNAQATASFTCVDQAGLSGVLRCVGTIAPGSSLDTGSVGVKSFAVTAEDVAGNTTTVSVSYSVQYNFSGFSAPVDNLPVINRLKAGSAVPVKFSLSGDQGLNIFQAGSPKVQAITCDKFAAMDDVEETVTAGFSSLTYDRSSDQYTYVWKTDSAWSNSCRQLSVVLKDGNTHTARFSFTK
jgi:hypothetical protein